MQSELNQGTPSAVVGWDPYDAWRTHIHAPRQRRKLNGPLNSPVNDLAEFERLRKRRYANPAHMQPLQERNINR